MPVNQFQMMGPLHHPKTSRHMYREAMGIQRRVNSRQKTIHWIVLKDSVLWTIRWLILFLTMCRGMPNLHCHHIPECTFLRKHPLQTLRLLMRSAERARLGPQMLQQ